MKLKTLLVFTALISSAGIANAELSIRENIRPISQSKLNPHIERLAIPATPNNMKLPAFGQGLIGWGTGPDGAEKRLNDVTKSDVVQMQQQGLTLLMAQEWQAFYENETRRNAGNPTAPFRAQLMKKIISLW